MLRISSPFLFFYWGYLFLRVDSTLVRRASHSSALIGDYIYVDGGQFGQMVNGVYDLDIETHTLSIPLDTSWTPAGVEINIINKTPGAPLLNSTKIWANPAGTGFYSYGGETSHLWTAPVPPRSLWNFTADGKGGGIWADHTSTAGETFEGLVRTGQGASDVLGNTAYYLGGIASITSDPSEANVGDVQTAVSGLVSFNMETGVWEHGTASGYAGTGKTSNSAMLQVPRFGSNGVLVVMGGTAPGANPSVTGGVNAPYVSFGNISIFDPSSNSWYSQSATGTIPEDRERFCVVGVQAADNLTYEIFMYGGMRVIAGSDTTWTNANNQLDEVYVLTLPKFEWTKANYIAKQNRHSHTCHVAGNRQMISIGGADASNPGIDGYNVPDPFPQSIGIFDLTEMAWIDSYSHDAAPYQRPAAVQTLYSGNSPFPSAWSSSKLEMLFTMTPATSDPASPSSSSSPSSPVPTTSTMPAASTSTSKMKYLNTSLQTGAIVVGACSAFAVVVALLGGLFLWRRRVAQINRQRFSILHDQISRPVPIIYPGARSVMSLTPEPSPSHHRAFSPYEGDDEERVLSWRSMESLGDSVSIARAR